MLYRFLVYLTSVSADYGDALDMNIPGIAMDYAETIGKADDYEFINKLIIGYHNAKAWD